MPSADASETDGTPEAYQELIEKCYIDADEYIGSFLHLLDKDSNGLKERVHSKFSPSTFTWSKALTSNSPSFMVANGFSAFLQRFQRSSLSS